MTAITAPPPTGAPPASAARASAHPDPMVTATAPDGLGDLAASIGELAAHAIAAARADAGRRQHAASSAVDPAERDLADDDGLAAIAALLRATDRLVAAVVVWLLGRSHRGIIADAGLTSDAWLRAVADRIGADAGMLTIAAERLADMPATLTAFCDGTLSWGAVRGIVTAARPLTGEQRRWLDGQLARDSRMTRLDGEQLASAAQHLTDQCRTDLADARAERTRRAQYVRLQPALDGTGGQVFAQLDAETFATFATALDTVQAPQPDNDTTIESHGDAEGDAHDDAAGGAPDGWRARREQSNVAALRLLSEQRLARTRRCPHHTPDDTPATDDDRGTPAIDASVGCCGGGAPSTARPSMLVVVDIAALTGDHRHPSDPVRGVAQLLARTGRPATIVSPDAAQRLACDATLRLVLTHGAEPIAVTEPDAKVSSALRAALTARDGGCRFPGCHTTAEACDAHHLVARADNGPTTLHNLALLCRAHHHAVHDGGWRPTLHTDATITFTRRGVTATSAPRAHWHQTPDERPPPGRPRRRRRTRPVDGTATDTAGATSRDDPTPQHPDDQSVYDHDPLLAPLADSAPHPNAALPF